jgi:ubiquinone/menaquinone biosynthesis C-methylase UbiE
MLPWESGQLHCPACRSTYPVRNDVPILLPSIEQQRAVVTQESEHISLAQLQNIYDRVYEHDGLMGTDLDNSYDRTTKEMLLSFGQPLAGKRLLDVGTGIGNLWNYAPADVEGYALDVSLTGVSKATEQHPHVTMSVSTAEYLPYPNAFFHVVVAADTLEHTFLPLQALREIHRVLQPGGVLSTSLPIPDSLRKWGLNEFVRSRPNVKLLIGLVRVLIKRTLLFGRPDFQPIDRDLAIEEWVTLLETVGFRVGRIVAWPGPPKLPIVTLVQALRD